MKSGKDYLVYKSGNSFIMYKSAMKWLDIKEGDTLSLVSNKNTIKRLFEFNVDFINDELEQEKELLIKYFTHYCIVKTPSFLSLKKIPTNLSKHIPEFSDKLITSLPVIEYKTYCIVKFDGLLNLLESFINANVKIPNIFYCDSSCRVKINLFNLPYEAIETNALLIQRIYIGFPLADMLVHTPYNIGNK